MKDNFQKSLAAVLKVEGGYVNDKNDNGGPTNFGITQKTYDAWCDVNKRKRQSVKFIGRQEAEAIYKGFWDAISGDELPPGIDYAVFDYAVHSGPARARIAFAKCQTINGLCDYRLGYLMGLPDWSHFGRGWASRIDFVRKTAIDIAGERVVAPLSPPVARPVVVPTPIQPAPVKPAVPAPKPPRNSLWQWIVKTFPRPVSNSGNRQSNIGEFNMLNGFKTYMLSMTGLGGVIASYLGGTITTQEALVSGLALLIVMALRHGVSVAVVQIAAKLANIGAGITPNKTDDEIAAIVDAAVKKAIADYKAEVEKSNEPAMAS